MGLFRLIRLILSIGKPAKRIRPLTLNRTQTARKPPSQYWVVHEKKFPPDAKQINGSLIAVAAGSREVRAAVGTISTQTHNVMISGCCHVVDGDTIYIGNTSIRLFGIDAPELDHPYGNNSKWALINLCKGQCISAVLEVGVTHDRVVATCFLPDGRDLSAEMVKLGMAVDWPKYSGGKYRHLEVPEIRRKLWRCDARQKGRMPTQ
jgi:micrococcal nuclease